MIRVLFISDTHGNETNLTTLLALIHPVDKIVHLGDVGGHRAQIEAMAGCPVIFVKGNCDPSDGTPHEAVVEAEEHKIFVTHGHLYHVKWSEDELVLRARALGCQIAAYGHTHEPALRTAMSEKGMTVFNPGSLSLPRQDNRMPSFVIMETDRFGKPHFTQAYLTTGGKIVFS